jgi:hypothetical protein
MPAVQPEIDALLACGAAPSDATSRVSEALARPVDWPLLLDLADGHGMLPLLSRAVSQCTAPVIPPAHLADLRARAAAKAMRSLYMTGELARVLRALDSAGLAPITFKGPTLAWLAYGNFGLRDSADLDIYVPRAQVAAAVEILAPEGYQRKSPGCFVWLRGECEMALDRRSPDCEIDLHWLFSPRYFLEFDARRAAERSILLRAPGLTARTLCPEDLLLFLAVHSGRECWMLVRSICDVAALVRNCPLDWDDVVREAGRGRCWRALAVGLRLAAGLFDAPVPPEILDRARRDETAARIAARVEATLYAQPANYSGAPGGALLQLGMLETALDKLRYLWRRSVHPNHFDADFVPLPERLAAGYYFIRPLRVASVALSRLTSSWNLPS